MQNAQEPGTADRGAIDANAVALVENLEARVARQRAELDRLNRGRHAIRRQNRRLRATLLAIHTAAMAALRTGQHNVTALWKIEADARAVLMADG
jgi:cell division protein FtsB